MTWGLVAGAAASVIGGAISSGSSKKASKAQVTSARAAGLQDEKSSKDAQAIQQFNLDRTRADSAPWVNAGEGALNQLAWKMGITPTSRINPEFTQTRDQIYNRLLGTGQYDQIWGKRMDLKRTDYGKLNAEADRLFNEQKSAQTQIQSQPQGDQADFGSLSRNFTMADRDADPVYQSGLQFGLDQGTQGIERQASATGSQLSGATLKALARYGNDYGTTKAQGAYERFGTNQATQYNRLSGIAGTGQQQVNQIGSAGQNFANTVGNNTMISGQNMANRTIDAGNARASNYLNQGQAWGNALNTGVNAWQQNRAMNNLYTGYGTQAPAPVERRY